MNARAMGSSRHEGGADILTSPADLYVALGVRLRERPGARWVLEMHPETGARFDRAELDRCFGSQDLRICERRDVAPGEYHLSQWGFDCSGDTRDRDD